MTRRFFAWIIAASLGLAPAGLYRLLPASVPGSGEMHIAPRPVRDPEPPQESPIEYVARAHGRAADAAVESAADQG